MSALSSTHPAGGATGPRRHAGRRRGYVCAYGYIACGYRAHSMSQLTHAAVGVITSALRKAGLVHRVVAKERTTTFVSERRAGSGRAPPYEAEIRVFVRRSVRSDRRPRAAFVPHRTMLWSLPARASVGG